MVAKQILRKKAPCDSVGPDALSAPVGLGRMEVARGGRRRNIRGQ